MQNLKEIVEGIHVSGTDLAIMGGYLVFILLAGIYLTRLASKGINSYFLGERRIPWWALGVSGTASYFDVSGVMWTVAFAYILGQRFMWIQWEWGFLSMIFFAAFMGRWLRRSKVMTGAEWMEIRFGRGPQGEFARVAYAVLAICIALAFIGFAEYGVGKFLNMFITEKDSIGGALAGIIPGLELQHKLAILLMLATAVYTVSAGLFGVILTDVIQFCLILIGSTILIVKAVGMATYDKIASEVPSEWFGFWPMGRWEHVQQWEMTEGLYFFAAVALVWVAKGMFLSFGGPQQLYDMQRFLSARSPREASKAGMLWGICMTPMFMLSAAVAVIGLVKWGGNLSDPEHLYPAVIGTMLPVGVKGLVLAGLLSAFMSTFSSTVNAGASYLVRDGYQKFIRPKAESRELVRASRLCSCLVIIAGIAVGVGVAKNIDTLFNWIMMILGTSVLVPNVLRWFWWRFNGAGYAVGTLVGVAASIASLIWLEDMPLYASFALLFGVSTVSSVAACMLSRPAEMETLMEFYRRVRPAGAWGPVKRALQAEGWEVPKREPFAMALVTVIVGMGGLQALFLSSTYACTHQWGAFAAALTVFAAVAVVLYFTWYRHLPDKDEDMQTGPIETE